MKAEAALGAYTTWYNHGTMDALHECVTLCMPIVRQAYYLFDVAPIGCLDTSDMWQDAIEAVHKLLLKKPFTPESLHNSRRTFTGLITQKAKWTFVNSIVKERNMRRDKDEVLGNRISGYVHNMVRVDTMLAFEQLVKRAAEVASRKIRFSGARRDACLYVLSKLATMEKVSPTVIRNQYCQHDVSFLIDYVSVLLRMVLYNVRASIKVHVGDASWSNLVSSIGGGEFSHA